MPIFSTDATYQGQRVDRNLLDNIVERMKRFGPASVIIGHTDQDNQYDEKEVVGLASNFRIADGDDGKTYLVCDIIVRDSEILNKYPRRSIELWDDYTIDPIALLGSSTPRVDLPVVIKYHREKNMSNEELKELAAKVLEILKETAEWKFLSELQQEWQEFQKSIQEAGQAQVAEGEPAAELVEEQAVEKQARDEGEEDVEDKKAEDADEKDEGDAQDKAHDEDSLEELDKLLSQFFEEEKKEEKPADEGDKADGEDKEKYYSPQSVFIPQMVETVALRGTRGNPSSVPTGRAGLYSRNNNDPVSKKIEHLLAENRKLKEMYRREKRAAILRQMVNEGYNIDVEDELKYTADFSDAKFVEHVKRIKQFYSRSPISPVNPAFIGNNTIITEELRDKAIELAYNTGISFEEAIKRLTNS
ncbi:MAG: hypothetical protein QXY15_04315 [Candidatus Nitrosotenuis sp.]